MTEFEDPAQHGIVYLMLVEYQKGPDPDPSMSSLMGFYRLIYAKSLTKDGKSWLRREFEIDKIPDLNKAQIADSLDVLEERGRVESYMDESSLRDVGSDKIVILRRYRLVGDVDLNTKIYRAAVNPDTRDVLKTLIKNDNHPMSHRDLYFYIGWNKFMESSERMLNNPPTTD